MAELTVTARGQVTFRKDVLRHLGVKPGEKIELELAPGGKGMITAARKTGSIEDFIGVLEGKTKEDCGHRGHRESHGARLGGHAMKAIVDSNVLIRAAVRDNARQARAAAALLRDAEVIVVSLTAICEFVAVLRECLQDWARGRDGRAAHAARCRKC